MEAPVLHVIDTDFRLYAEVVRYASLRLKLRHYDTGEFELHLHPGEAGAAALLENRVILPLGHPEKAMLIKKVVRTEGKDELTVSGRTLDGLTRQRIALPPKTTESTFGWDRIVGDAETVLKHYAQVNMTAPEEEVRRFHFLDLEENLHRGMANLPWQARFDELDALLGKIAKYADIGWDIVPDMAARRFVFRVRPGRDLTQGNRQGRRVVVSAAMGNLSRLVYTRDITGAKNQLYVGGAGEDEQRLILAVGEAASGLARHEGWADAGSIDSAVDLQEEGRHRIQDLRPTIGLDCDVLPFGAMQYGRDWRLGDKVTVIGERAAMDARVTEVQELYEADKPVRLDVTFADPPQGIVDIIRGLQHQTVR